jgi:hypothetical protein
MGQLCFLEGSGRAVEEMEGDGGRWREMEGDGGRWRGMEEWYGYVNNSSKYLPRTAGGT